MPLVKFYFYSPVTTGDDFSSLFADLYSSYGCNSRKCVLDGKQCILLDDRFSADENISSALFTKVRMNELPPRQKLDGSRKALDLDDDEGLGEDVAVAYHKGINVLAIQKNKYSLSDNQILCFFEHFYPGKVTSFLPLLSKNTLQKLSKFNLYRKLKIKFSRTNNFDFIQNSDILTNEDKILFQMFLSGNDPYLELTLSMGYEKGGLSERVHRIVRALTSFRNKKEIDCLRILQLTARQEQTGDTVALDLIADRLFYENEVKQGKDRVLDRNQLLKVGCASISSNYRELRDYHEEHQS